MHPGSAGLHASLASYYDLLQDTSSALNIVDIASKLDPHDKNVAWFHLKVHRRKVLEDKRTCLQESLSDQLPQEYKMPSPVEVSKNFCKYTCTIQKGMAEKQV